jgi:Ribonucleotide reductase, barrel domain
MKNVVIVHNRSVQNIPNIPADVKAIYKAVWEISQKKILDLAADRRAYMPIAEFECVSASSLTVRPTDGGNGLGILTPSSSVLASPGRNLSTAASISPDCCTCQSRRNVFIECL